VKPVRATVAALVLVAGLGCSPGRTAAVVAAPGEGEIRPGAVPSVLLGLRTAEEDVTAAFQEAGDRAYVTGVKLWSLRQGERLRATLQIARFAPDAPATTEAFRRRVAAQIGGTAPRARRVDDDRVYVSAGNRQVHYVWFRDVHLVLLSVPAETRNGRGLLRAALQEVAP
jgi:hypothetical protein